MTKKETLNVLAIIKGAYYYSYNNITEIESGFVFEIWNDSLKDCAYRIVMKALKQYIKTNKYPPSIADILSLYQEIRIEEYQKQKAINEDNYRKQIEAEQKKEKINEND